MRVSNSQAYSSLGLISVVYASSLTLFGASWSLCRSKHNLRKEEEETLVTCEFQLKLFVKVMPKYLYSWTWFKGFPAREYENWWGFRLLVMRRETVLSGFSTMPHSRLQERIAAREEFRASWSLIEWILLKITQLGKSQGRTKDNSKNIRPFHMFQVQKTD